MNQHGAVVELGAGVVEKLRVNVLADILDLIDRGFPVGGKDLARKLAPRRGRDLVVVGRQNAELVEHIGGGAVLAATELKLAKVVEGVDHFQGDLRGGEYVSFAWWHVVDRPRPSHRPPLWQLTPC